MYRDIRVGWLLTDIFFHFKTGLFKTKRLNMHNIKNSFTPSMLRFHCLNGKANAIPTCTNYNSHHFGKNYQSQPNFDLHHFCTQFCKTVSRYSHHRQAQTQLPSPTCHIRTPELKYRELVIIKGPN